MSACFILTYGDMWNGDYQVLGAFSTLENAELMKKWLKETHDQYDIRIEEFENDRGVVEVVEGLKLYNVVYLNPDTSPSIEQSIDIGEEEERHGNRFSRYFVWAKDEESARVIASGRHANYLMRKEEGTT